MDRGPLTFFASPGTWFADDFPRDTPLGGRDVSPFLCPSPARDGRYTRAPGTLREWEGRRKGKGVSLQAPVVAGGTWVSSPPPTFVDRDMS